MKRCGGYAKSPGITIDGIPLLFPSAGVKNYLYYWIWHLQQEASRFDVRLFRFLEMRPRLDHEHSAITPVATTARLALWHLLKRFSNDVSGWIDPNVAIFHACKLLNPPCRAKLTRYSARSHCWLMPEMHKPSNVAFEKLFAARVLKRAGALIAVSASTRDDC
jgi:hypothetical protein